MAIVVSVSAVWCVVLYGVVYTITVTSWCGVNNDFNVELVGVVACCIGYIVVQLVGTRSTGVYRIACGIDAGCYVAINVVSSGDCWRCVGAAFG